MNISEQGKHEGQEYQDLLANFRWDQVLQELDWPAEGSVSLAGALIDRHRDSDRLALIYIDASGKQQATSYRQLYQDSNRMANTLRRLGVNAGDRVAGLMPRGPEVIISILGILKLGAVYVPIFTGFGRDAVQFRLEHSEARLVVTHCTVRDQLPEQLHADVLCVYDDQSGVQGNDRDFWTELEGEQEEFLSIPRSRNDIAALIYTSGSTGRPKGGVIVINFLAAVWPYINYGLDVREDDIFWPTGDPGWGYGFVCYLGALARGCTIVSLRSNPGTAEVVQVLKDCNVTNLATTPTLLRSLMASGNEVRATGISLRAISSCGEPLNSEAVEFFKDVWGAEPMDHFGATEYGLPIGNFNAPLFRVKPGSMGRPFPGVRVAVLNDQWEPVAPGKVGALGKAFDESSLYWISYWNDPEASAQLVQNGWIVTGDLVRQDEEGYYWFEGREGDMIKSAGYRIGPFEVESALLTHPSVAEAAVVGKADCQRGQIVKAYVILLPGYEPHTSLAEALKQHVKTSMGKHLYPREIEFVTSFPKTETGKIQRFLLRAETRP